MQDLRFDHLYRYQELTEAVRGLAASCPHLMAVESIGKSHEGRDIWLATVTNTATGPHHEKPALFVEANIHATEVTASTAALHLLHRLVTGYGDDADVTCALDTRCFYVVPRLNPDGVELALADRPRFVRSSTRAWPFPELQDGLVEEDVDDDGRILTMRVPDPNGPWKVSSDDPRLLVPREPHEAGSGPFWRLLPEGTIRNYDGVLVPLAPRVEGLDLNRQFPAGWRTEGEQAGAGPYPGSEPEIAALLKAVAARPNLCAYIAYHTYGGVHLRPYSDRDDDQLPTSDLRTYVEIGKQATAITGYRVVSVYHGFRYEPKEVITGASDDWAYDHLGVYGWTTEFWSPITAAGIVDHKFIEWYDDHPLEDDLALLRWSDETVGRNVGYVDWYPFEHPQLGPVELGGWHFFRVWSNPPSALIEAEVAPHSEFAVRHLLLSPRLELREASASLIGPPGAGSETSTWRVRVVVDNTGWMSTNVTERAQERKVVRPLEAEISLPDGATLASGTSRLNMGQLSGRALKRSSILASDPTGDRAKAEWVVAATAGAVVTVEIRHQRAGVVRVEVELAAEEG
ncbi:MAG TPA: M14 family metallopeptidase [Acidimicrobiales bacterium]|nr:M14 family metallopeptidase [Acidimicrobiales bacterium]